MKKSILGLVVLCTLLGGYWAAQPPGVRRTVGPVGGGPAARRPGPGAPPTAVVTNREIHFAVSAAGEIGPLDAVSVRPEVGGLISKLSLDIGDKVKRGEVLFELDDRDLQTEKSSRKTEIAGAKLAVETQRILLERSRLSFERVQDLFAERLVSQEVFDNARLDHELTQNHLNIALNRLETAQTALQQVEDKLGKTVIRAPFDCTILTRPVSVGQAVSGASGFNSGTEVFSVANLTDMIVTAHINQADVTRLKVGQAVSVQVEAVPGLKLAGQVDRIAPQATFRNGVKGFSTRILLKNAEGAVRPGMTANLSIPWIASGPVPAVPLGAVFADQDERYVYVKREDDRFERRSVELGVSDYDYAEVTKGLRVGEAVSLLTPPAEALASVTPAGAGAGAAPPTRAKAASRAP